MKKESDLDGVKAIAKALLMTDICTTPYSPVIVQHPFTSTGFVVIPTEKHTGFQPIDITLNDENLKKWQDSMRRIIEKAAIIDAGTFGRVQEELARRSGKKKIKQVGTKTEQGKYSSKYALTELLVCGECGTPYRRCTWTARGQKKIVWRCINRLDYGTKYCHHSPSIEESVLQEAIMKAIMQTAKQNADVLKTLKLHIGIGLDVEETEDKSLDIQIRIAEIDAEFKKMLNAVSEGNIDTFDEEHANELMNEKQRLVVQLEQYANAQQKRENAQSRLDQIFTILDGMQNHPMEYDDRIVRQLLECVVVESKETVKVVFVGGLEVREQLNH